MLVSTCTINVVSGRITILIQQTGIRRILAQDITENIIVTGEVKTKYSKSQPDLLNLCFLSRCSPAIVLTST